jgi:DNA repair protein RecN (Recombination protein N)
VAEVARMLGGERLSGTSLAHAQEMLTVGGTASASASASVSAPTARTPTAKRKRP